MEMLQVRKAFKYEEVLENKENGKCKRNKVVLSLCLLLLRVCSKEFTMQPTTVAMILFKLSKYVLGNV